MRWMTIVLMLVGGCAAPETEEGARWRRAVGAGLIGIGASANAYRQSPAVRTTCSTYGWQTYCRSR